MESTTLYVENDNQTICLYYNKRLSKWLDGGHSLNDARVGYDPYEPEDSPYRYGCGDCLKDIKEITKEEAEQFIGKEINSKELEELLNK